MCNKKYRESLILNFRGANTAISIEELPIVGEEIRNLAKEFYNFKLDVLDYADDLEAAYQTETDGKRLKKLINRYEIPFYPGQRLKESTKLTKEQLIELRDWLNDAIEEIEEYEDVPLTEIDELKNVPEAAREVVEDVLESFKSDGYNAKIAFEDVKKLTRNVLNYFSSEAEAWKYAAKAVRMQANAKLRERI